MTPHSGRSRHIPSSILLVLSLSFILQASSHAGEIFSPPDCGISSLYLLLESTGRRVNLGDLYQALPPRHRDGYSLLELKNAAGRCGVDLQGRSVSRADLPLEHPVIAYFNVPRTRRGHYVVLNPVGTTGAMVQIIDPPYFPRIVSDHDFIPVGNSIMILDPISSWWGRFLLVCSVGASMVLLATILLFRGRARQIH